MGLFSSIFGKKPGAMEAEVAEPEVPESNEELSEALGSSDGASRVDAAPSMPSRSHTERKRGPCAVSSCAPSTSWTY